MKQTTIDDALIGLLSAVMLQAVEDYRNLQRKGVYGPDGEIFDSKFGRIKGSRSYRHCDGMSKGSEAAELRDFFLGWPIELLCDLTGHQACRIRKALGIQKEVL